jgi:hypothetical protein
MRTRNRGLKASARWRVPALSMGLLGVLSGALGGCPNQELAPLAPCTVSGVSLVVPQTGVDKVDLLFVIDNSASMAEEQKKLSDVLPNLVTVLTTGNRMPKPAGERPDFPPVRSLHIGVISTDLGVNLAPNIDSCGGSSFNPIAPDPNAQTAAARMNELNLQRLEKLFGDNAQLQTSTAVAVAGISARPFGAPPSVDVSVVVPPEPRCANLGLPPGQPFINFEANVSDAAQTAVQFGCIAKLGKNGCGLEQQLEAMYKALAPSSEVFSRNTRGQGSPPGTNIGFLRDDAVLTVVHVSDEEDCSIPDASSDLFGPNAPGDDINVRCGRPQNQERLHPASRYVDGLKKLKSPAYQDRIIFAAIVGIPLAVNLRNQPAHSGKETLDAILARDDMKFVAQPQTGGTGEEPRPVCISPSGDSRAAPARRFLQVASAFGENGVVTSICEEEYGSALKTVIDKIAAQLGGACLPRELRPVNGKVECDVVEIKSPTDAEPCDPNKGRTQLPSRNGRTVCHVEQVGVNNGVLEAGKQGWYYDNFSPTVMQDCKTNRQRIAFTENAETSPGAEARFECFQPVAPAVDQNALGRDAVNMNCGTDNALCAQRSNAEYSLICVAGGCQIACQNPANCPDGWVCVPEGGYCVNPTCPPAISTE